jgi:Mn2+/Fe2+ NRAMP family transporter
MNPKRLLKHFPEIATLPEAEQRTLLDKAYKDVFSQENKMRNWRNNLISAIIMTSLCIAFVLILRPLLEMSQQTSALLLLVVALPVYFYIQQRRFIQQLRTSLKKFLP